MWSSRCSEQGREHRLSAMNSFGGESHANGVAGSGRYKKGPSTVGRLEWKPIPQGEYTLCADDGEILHVSLPADSNLHHWDGPNRRNQYRLHRNGRSIHRCLVLNTTGTTMCRPSTRSKFCPPPQCWPEQCSPSYLWSTCCRYSESSECTPRPRRTQLGL
jgi:hypothetical protein